MAIQQPPVPVFFDYTSLITSQHKQKPNFAFVVGWLANSVGQMVDAFIAMASLFDLDNAQGEQLDFIGKWINVSRRLEVPLNIFFSWDTTDLGWDEGVWLGGHEDGSFVVLMDDDTYRNVLQAMALGNHWDGTLTSLQPILQTAFPKNTIWMVDNQDMTVDIHVTGPHLPDIVVAALQGPLAALRPAGVAIANYHLPA